MRSQPGTMSRKAASFQEGFIVKMRRQYDRAYERAIR
jgi:hypothetical protein